MPIPLGKAMNVVQCRTAHYVDHEQTRELGQGEAACDLVVVAEFPSLEAMRATYATPAGQAALAGIPKMMNPAMVRWLVVEENRIL
jgi:uncharacterized protein (DUF1330 family)